MTRRRVLLVLGLAAAAFLWAYRSLSGSLPALDGEIVLDGLGAPVVVERDASGVPTLHGDGRSDLARALGFLHAQERFFQMDLLRRRAAGELSEILGSSTLEIDRYHRLHRMRERARRVVEAASPEERALLSSYVDGVNAGLAALDAAPFEYYLLRADPAPWRLEDSVLVVLSMFFELNDDRGELESARKLVKDVFPRELADFLTPAGSVWDAPLFGDALLPAPIPGPGVVEVGMAQSSPVADVDNDVGSNNWVLAGTKTASGVALLASDMHLGHGVPNVWYRAVMSIGSRRLVGVTLPGTPSLVAGSNGNVAWGFTNTGADWVDLVEIDPDAPFEIHRETIAVAGEASTEVEVRETEWGPIVDKDHGGRERALRWIAHSVEAVNLRLARLEEARTVEEALAIAPTVGIPPQNFVVADRVGSIGWTVAGRIPRRGLDGSWNGYFTAEEYPALLNPPSGAIWTANARVVEGDALAKMGDGGYALGARAKQIRDALLAIDDATEKDMLRIQLDDRAIFLETWRELFLGVAHDDVAEILREGWTGHASIDSAGYRAVRDLRRAVFEEVMGTLTAKAKEADPRFHAGQLPQWEGPLWKLVTEKPPHLVPEPYGSWDEWLSAIVSRTAATWPRPLERRTWGEANTSAIAHPLSSSLSFASRFLDAPPRPLPGHTDMPRVQSPSSGASERLVVSPGREEEGVFHMPGGQSGHPLSPYYLAGHQDWEEGRPTPLLPGKTAYKLRLVPR
jgi:penicillin amidase